MKVHQHLMGPTGRRCCAITCITDTPVLLAHWVEHYRALGVSEIVAAVGSPKGDLQFLDTVIALALPIRIAPYTYGPHYSMQKTWMMYAAARLLQPEDQTWMIYADVDEFHEYPAPLHELIEACERGAIDAVVGDFVDHVAAHGLLPEVAPAPSIWEQFPIACSLSVSVLGAFGQKVMLARHRVKLRGSGLHHTDPSSLYRWPIGLRSDYRVHHFKWTAGVMERLRKRLRGACHPAYRRESARFLDWYESNAQRIRVDDARLCSRWCGKPPLLIAE